MFNKYSTYYISKVRFWLSFLLIQDPRLFLSFRGPGGLSGTIPASPMKICTVIELLKAYQNTKEILKNLASDDMMTLLLKRMGKLGPPRNQANYISFER